MECRTAPTAAQKWMVRKMVDADRCVCCGEIVPEGRMVCPQCEYKAKENKNERPKQNR